MNYLLLSSLLLNITIIVCWWRCEVRVRRHKYYIKYLYSRIVALAGDER